MFARTTTVPSSEWGAGEGCDADGSIDGWIGGKLNLTCHVKFRSNLLMVWMLGGAFREGYRRVARRDCPEVSTVNAAGTQGNVFAIKWSHGARLFSPHCDATQLNWAMATVVGCGCAVEEIYIVPESVAQWDKIKQ